MFIQSPRMTSRFWITSVFICLVVVCTSIHAGRTCFAQESRLVGSPCAEAADQHIRAALRQAGSWNFHDMPLDKVIDEFGRNLGINVRLDNNSLKDAAIDPTATPITLRLQNVSGESALRALLRQYNLDWMISDEALVIVTKDKANTCCVTRIYPVRDLVQSRSRTDATEDCDSLIDLITTTIEAQTWSDVGGTGAMQYFSSAGTLVVTQSAAKFTIKSNSFWPRCVKPATSKAFATRHHSWLPPPASVPAPRCLPPPANTPPFRRGTNRACISKPILSLTMRERAGVRGRGTSRTLHSSPKNN